MCDFISYNRRERQDVYYPHFRNEKTEAYVVNTNMPILEPTLSDPPHLPGGV